MAVWKPSCGVLDSALGLGIYDGLKNEAEAELFRVLLFEAAGVSHVRQLYEVFGADCLLKFFDLFAGVTLEVPSREKIERAIRDTRIFFLLNRAKVGYRSEQSRQLAREFDMSPHTVNDIFFRIRKRFDIETELRCQLKNRVK